MKPDKLIKKQIIKEASSNPEKYFPVKTLKSIGLKRQECENCGTMFWSSVQREVCGDTSCIGVYSFIGNPPTNKKLEFGEVYFEFKRFMSSRGYLPVNRFPIVARWRSDLDFNIASIIGFQPFITKGIVPPPSNLVTIPQNCLRFPDIDNVGYSGRHGTNFIMIGQLAFEIPEKYDQSKYFTDFLEWFTKIMEIQIDEIQIHEDAWVGGGDCGPSLEFFSRGLEIGNQVFMWFDMSNAKDISEIKSLKLKVLDMGMGLERCCWISKGSKNMYEASMPKVCKYLFEKSGLKPDWDLYEKFLPYSGTLNLDEIEDIDLEWEKIGKEVGVDAKNLKEAVDPIAGIYSIADHSKTLIYALSDGALPSNVKGGYNLRLVLRRALDFIYKFKWDIDFFEVIKMQAKEIENLFPEMNQNLAEIEKIIQNEIEKYEIHKSKVESKIRSLIKKKLNSNNKKSEEVIKVLTDEEFVKYYISDGVTPDEIQSVFKNNKVNIKIPTNFFTQVNEFFDSRNHEKITNNQDFEVFTKGVSDTKLLFYENSYQEKGKSQILKKFEIKNKKYVILDKTLFYPTMGGQVCDLGKIGEKQVVDVFKIGNVVIHEVE